MTISLTPAIFAGITHISTDDGYAAVPPVHIRRHDEGRRMRWPSITPSSSVVSQLCCTWAAVETLYIRCGAAQHLKIFALALLRRFPYILTVKYAFFRYKSVKFFRIFIYCAVAVFAHVVYYFRHRLRDGPYLFLPLRARSSFKKSISAVPSALIILIMQILLLLILLCGFCLKAGQAALLHKITILLYCQAILNLPCI